MWTVKVKCALTVTLSFYFVGGTIVAGEDFTFYWGIKEGVRVTG